MLFNFSFFHLNFISFTKKAAATHIEDWSLVKWVPATTALIFSLSRNGTKELLEFD